MLTGLKHQLAEVIAQVTGREASFILGLFESPKNIAHGHIAFPVFFMAREKKKAPTLIAQDLAFELEKLSLESIQSVSPTGGYVNIQVKDRWLQNSLSEQLQAQGDRFGFFSKRVWKESRH